MKNVHHDNQVLYNFMCSGLSAFEFPGYQSTMIVSERRNKIHHEYRKENLREHKIKEARKINAFEIRSTAKDLLPQR